MSSSLQSTGQVVLQIVGYKNSGKTTLITELIRRLKQAGHSVGTVKHDAHQFQIDYPQTDTWKHQEAGADVTAISSSNRSAILKSYPESLAALLTQMDEVNIVLVEGFKQASYPKLVLLRTLEDLELLRIVSNPIAVILWPQAIESLSPDNLTAEGLIIDSIHLKCFELSNTDSIYTFVKSFLE